MRESLGSNLSHQLNVDEEIKLLEGKISSLESRVSSQVIGCDKYFSSSSISPTMKYSTGKQLSRGKVPDLQGQEAHSCDGWRGLRWEPSGGHTDARWP